MKIVYLINQYPRASHTFIRTEIEALESMSFRIERITVCESDGVLVDERDTRERDLLRTALKRNVLSLIAHVLYAIVKRPAGFLRAFACSMRMGWRSPTGLFCHFGYLAEACVLLRWTRLEEVEHVHAHFGTNSTAVTLLCRHMGGPPYSFTVHGTETFDTPAFLSLPEKIDHAEFVAAVSWHGRALLQRWTPERLWPKLRLVRCVPDSSFLSGPETPPPSARRLVCVARLSAEKGIFTLLDAAAELRRDGIDFELIVVGDGPLHDEVVDRVRTLGIDACVKIVGWKSSDDVRREICASRALVQPSYAEGLPVAIMEALALGRPVIATYVGGIPELVRPGIEGWLVPPGSVEDLKVAMRAALELDPRELARRGRIGRESVRQQHACAIEMEKLSAGLRASAVRRAA